VQDDEPFGHEPDDDPDGSEVDPLLPPFLVPVSDELAPPIQPTPATRIPHRYRSSIGASVVAAGLIGLRDVIEEPKDDRPVVEQFADEGDKERPIEVDLDPDDPTASVVRLRDV
jgi:hypothetical protein